MGKLSLFLKYILLILIVFIAHVFVLNAVPYPANHINIILIIFLWLIIYSGSEKILWATLPLTFLLELFVSFPYGITSVALVFTVAIMHWLLLNIFTNRSYYMAFLSGLISIVLYRSTFVALLLFMNLFNKNFTFSWSDTSNNMFYEIVLTTLLFFILYFLSSLFIRRFNPKYISARDIYGSKRNF